VIILAGHFLIMRKLKSGASDAGQPIFKSVSPGDVADADRKADTGNDQVHPAPPSFETKRPLTEAALS
jgi:hypothetical protein